MEVKDSVPRALKPRSQLVAGLSLYSVFLLRLMLTACKRIRVPHKRA